MRIFRVAAVLAQTAAVSACSDPDKARVRQTTVPTYDQSTGKLIQLTSDRNKNGRIDTWTDMDGSRPLRSRVDLDEDGRIDRWEYYDATGALVKVGFSRTHEGKPDAWAFADGNGRIVRVEVSSTADERHIDRWEHFDPASAGQDAAAPGPLAAVEEDANGDGRPDKWERYANGVLATVAFDENFDGRADRRLTYDDGRLVRIESEPDASGTFRKVVNVQ
jgi:hypothetical protein